jgi:hypothetical protein
VTKEADAIGTITPGPDSSIPSAAEELRDFSIVLEDLDYRRYDCVLKGERVGCRVRRSDGRLVREIGIKDGHQHGLWREWDAEGRLTFETFYLNGIEHGTARHWHEGVLQITYHLDHGTGVDLWGSFDSLSEERHLLAGQRHGYERWWNGDNRTVWQEEHFRNGAEHGIFRRWQHGRLRRGYPQYFVDGRRVTKRQYLKACAGDPFLPAFRSEENAPGRTLPGEYRRQRPERAVED